MLRRFGLWAPVVLYMAAIFYVSALSEPPIPEGTDKPLHGLAYLGLALVVVRAVVGGLPRRIGPTTQIGYVRYWMAKGALPSSRQDPSE